MNDMRHILDKEGVLLNGPDKQLMLGFRDGSHGLEAHYFVLHRGREVCSSNRLPIALAYYRGIK